MKPLAERMLVRIARQIRDQLQGPALRQMSVTGERTGQLTGALARIEPFRRKLTMVCVRGWAAAAREMAERLARQARDIVYNAESIERAASSRSDEVPSLRNLTADMEQPEEEFGEECCSFQDHVLAVTTESTSTTSTCESWRKGPSLSRNRTSPEAIHAKIAVRSDWRPTSPPLWVVMSMAARTSCLARPPRVFPDFLLAGRWKADTINV